MRLLKLPDAWLRYAAMEVLAAIGSEASESVEVLRQLTADETSLPDLDFSSGLPIGYPASGIRRAGSYVNSAPETVGERARASIARLVSPGE